MYSQPWLGGRGGGHALDAGLRPMLRIASCGYSQVPGEMRHQERHRGPGSHALAQEVGGNVGPVDQGGVRPYHLQ